MSRKIDELLKQLINLHPKYIDLSLTRLLKLLNKIGNPHLKIPPVIHIAGTNGKGSTLSYLKHILIENNFNIHAYISPHLKIFNERIILTNKEIKTPKLLKTLQYIKKINDNNPITFYEITTAAAFYLFSKEKADFLILETGLGGRLDATNVIKESLIDIITPIGIDHQEYLGKNILKITNEKLGIIKKGSSIIISKQNKIVRSHIKEKLSRNTNEKFFFNEAFKIINKTDKKFILRYKKKENTFNNPRLIGDHQIENASNAIMAIFKLNEKGYSISLKNINNGILKTEWPGRLELGKLGKAKVYLDGAHNIEGAKQLSIYFKKKNIKVWLMIGMLRSKDLYGYLKTLKSILHGVVAIPIPEEKNIYKPSEIEKVCDKLNLKNFSQNSVGKANVFLKNYIKPKVILVSGSLYLVGKIRNKYL